jgi:hypothetical protein
MPGKTAIERIDCEAAGGNRLLPVRCILPRNQMQNDFIKNCSWWTVLFPRPDRDGWTWWQSMHLDSLASLAGSMHQPCLTIALVLTLVCPVPGRAQSSPPGAADLVKVVVANELTDRVELRRWMYTVEKHEGKQTLTEVQVETGAGPFERLLAIDGRAIDPSRRRQEDARIERLLHDPSEQLKVKRAHDEDEQKLETLLRVMPEAFLFDSDGWEGNLVRIKFHPNPSYSPSTYEGRVVHCLAGTILIDPRQKRLASLSGQLVNPVEFGYGLLGRIESGGTVKIGRVEVGASRWKTALIDIQLSGRLILFKTINKQEYQTRSDFRAVSGDLTLWQANELTVSRTVSSPPPRITHPDPQPAHQQLRP